MRQLIIQVPRGQGKTVLDMTGKYNGSNVAQVEATGTEGPLDMVFVHVSNRKVEKLLGDLEGVPDLRVTVIPRGVMPLRPPASQASEQVKDVELRSPIEIFLAGLQSIGSWKGFLGYAASAGVVVWIGLLTNTVYLLTAAMLIAPFAGPAMNTAIATARGDGHLLKHGLLRYFTSLATAILISGALTLIFGPESVTDQMIATSQVSTVAVLLPLVAGAAGALNLVQSERDSLVSGAAVGLLVAASLAPPAGLIGMASVMGRWDMVFDALFVLLLQLIGINLSGSLVFRVCGLSPQGTRYDRGKGWVFSFTLAVTIVLLIGMLTLQFSIRPDLQRSSLAQRATSEIEKVVKKSHLAELVEANVRFTRANIEDRNTLLGVIYVQRRPESTLPSEEIRSRLTRSLQSHLVDQGFDVTPLITVDVLEPPASSP